MFSFTKQISLPNLAATCRQGMIVGFGSLFYALSACAQPPEFSPVQQDLFSVAGSLSNAWADYDNDGDLDFAVSIIGGEIRLYRNDNGSFVNVGPANGLPTSGDHIRGLSWGDYDNDGDLDLFAGSNVSPMPSRSYVYRNDLGNGFTEVAVEIGLDTPGRFSRQSNWIDYDNDGDLDLYGSNRAGPNWLLNNENGAHTALGFPSGARDSRRTVGVCWFDFDGDGDLDAFLANQAGDSDALLRNDGDKFVDVAPSLGLDQTLRTQKEGGVGCAVGDYDNDGDFDLYVAAYGKNLLYRNNGDGTFKEIGEAMGVADPDRTVGAAWGDYDNDGLLDLLAVSYRRLEGVQTPFNKLYRNTGAGFENAIVLDHTINVGDHGVEWIDYDLDGDIDLSVTDGYGAEGGHFLFRNELKETQRKTALAVIVLDQNGHATRAGAEVRLYDRAGDILASRLMSTGGGYNTQSVTPVFFGGINTETVRLEVRFMGPDGGSVQIIDNVVLSDHQGQILVVRQER